MRVRCTLWLPYVISRTQLAACSHITVSATHLANTAGHNSTSELDDIKSQHVEVLNLLPGNYSIEQNREIYLNEFPVHH